MSTNAPASVKYRAASEMCRILERFCSPNWGICDEGMTLEISLELKQEVQQHYPETLTQYTNAGGTVSTYNSEASVMPGLSEMLDEAFA